MSNKIYGKIKRAYSLASKAHIIGADKPVSQYIPEW